MLKLYGLRKCTTCQKAVAWLDGKKRPYHFTDVKEEGVTAAQVAKWVKAVGGWEKLINRAGYTWRGLKPSETAGLTEEKAITLAVKYPSLIRRPFIEHKDGVVTTGFADKVKGIVG